MTKQKIEIELDVPEGWKVVGYSMPRRGDRPFGRLILERLDRVPTYDDLHTARMKGDKVWVQARDDDNMPWGDPQELFAVLDGSEYPFLVDHTKYVSARYRFARIVDGPDATCKDGGNDGWPVG